MVPAREQRDTMGTCGVGRTPAPPSLKLYRGAGVSGELHLRIGVSRVRHQGPIITGAVM